MDACIFCQIIEEKSPCYKIYEDGLFLGFLDIYPRTVGHSLLIPKKHYRWIYELPEFEKYWQTVLKITQAMQKSLKPTFITYVTHGLEVAHAHIHILPRKQEIEFIPPKISLPKEEMEKVANKISQAIKNERF